MRVVPVPFKGQHNINNVLQHPRARQLTVLGDMPHRHNGGTGGLGEMNQLGAAVANLAWGPWHGIHASVVHQLNGVQDQNIRLVLAGLFQDAPQGGLRQEKKVVQPIQAAHQTFCPQANLIGRLFAAGIQHPAR